MIVSFYYLFTHASSEPNSNGRCCVDLESTAKGANRMVPVRLSSTSALIVNPCDGSCLARNITFAFQMPLPRGGVQLDYSRWMQNLLTLLIPEVRYDTRLSGASPPGDLHINATVVMSVRLGVKNIGDSDWKEYYRKDDLKRAIT